MAHKDLGEVTYQQTKAMVECFSRLTVEVSAMRIMLAQVLEHTDNLPASVKELTDKDCAVGCTLHKTCKD